MEEDAFFMDMKIMHATCLERWYWYWLFSYSWHRNRFLSVHCFASLFFFSSRPHSLYYITKSFLVFLLWVFSVKTFRRVAVVGFVCSRFHCVNSAKHCVQAHRRCHVSTVFFFWWFFCYHLVVIGLNLFNLCAWNSQLVT